MRGMPASLPAILSLIVMPVALLAKGYTVRITIQGGDLAAPIQITDPDVVRTFNVWMGPGASSNERQGLIVDWSRGIAKPPKDLPVYQVLIATTRRNPGTYVVSYVIDPSTNEGYVYLPGKDDPEFRDNSWLIYRGVEGNWFHAWSEWQKVADRLIAKAGKVH